MKLEIRYKISGKILSIALVGVIMLCSSCLMLIYDPLQLIIKRLLAMTPGTVFYNIWAAPPYDVIMKLYIFNVSNPEKFFNGEEKLSVTQVGPYAYKEILTHNNATLNDDGTLTFTPKREFLIDRENSIGDASVDRVIVPNIPLLGIQGFLQDASFITNIGFSTLSATLGAEPFLNLTIEEFLWGYEDKLVKIANQFLPNWIDFDKFGLLERLMSRDNTNFVTISVEPGKRASRYDFLLKQEELMLPFHIVEWNGSPGLKEWGFEEPEANTTNRNTKRCQLVEGAYDGTIFPRPMKKTDLTLFRKAFCRPVELEFIEESHTKQGFKSFNYKMKRNMFASPKENPYNECFCYKGLCPDKGLQTIAPCYYGMAVVLSQPHFLNVDPEILKTVNGLEPDDEKHASIAKVSPDLGVPLDESSLKIQVNLGMGETRYNSRTKPFNHLTVPLFWIDLTCYELPSLIAFLLTLILDILPVAENILAYLLGLIGLSMIAAAALLALFFSKTAVPRSLSIAHEYSAIPLISLPAQYLKPELKRLCK